MLKANTAPNSKITHFWVFIKSAVVQKNLKLGVVNTWVISIVQIIFVATATCLEGVDLFTPDVEGVYSVCCTSTIIIAQYFNTAQLEIQRI